jgi:arylsulfatase A-like enzyme
MRPSLLLVLGCAASCAELGGEGEGPPPNLLLILTDDQGWGDVGIHGNPRIRTPNLDRLARQSIRMDQFHAMPVCSPTRACLLTGRYFYRTGVVDTYIGRSLMHADETTLAEILREAGWRTGIFGKWHLGDNFPLRAVDQGFQEAFTLKGGGIGQPSDPPGGDSYFHPTLYRNGKATKTDGYVTDVLTDAALAFVGESTDRPFFAYVPFNAPHEPLEAPPALVESYRRAGIPDTAAKVYAMVTNIDDNVGRLLEKLRETGKDENTIVVFLTDNGPQHDRYNGGMRGRKGTVFQGGIRVPCFIRWPARLKPRVESAPAALIDLLPTFLEAAGLPSRPVDGRSLYPLLKFGAPLPDRSLFFQWHRGDAPTARQACAVRNGRWKLVRLDPKGPPLLFDLEADPGESKDLAGINPEIVGKLQADYDAWFAEVGAARGYAPPRIVVGSAEENPSVLTRQDWRGPAAGWTPRSHGSWELEAAQPGSYDVRLRFAPLPAAAKINLRVAGQTLSKEGAPGTKEMLFPDLALPAGPFTLYPWIEVGPETLGVLYAEIGRD